MRRDGFSIIEVMVVIILIGILAGLATVNYRTWRARYDTERQMRQAYSDIIKLRVMSKTKGMAHFVSLGTGQIKAYEDTDGSGTLNAAADKSVCMWDRKEGQAADASCPNTQSVSSSAFQFPINWSGGATLGFDSRGLANADSTICIDFSVVDATANTSYDCIDVSATRVSIGKLANQGGACSSANCQKKE